MIREQQVLYNKLINKINSEITDSGEEVNRSAMLMQLRKAANHPLLHRVRYTDKVVHKMASALCKVCKQALTGSDIRRQLVVDTSCEGWIYDDFGGRLVVC